MAGMVPILAANMLKNQGTPGAQPPMGFGDVLGQSIQQWGQQSQAQANPLASLLGLMKLGGLL